MKFVEHVRKNRVSTPPQRGFDSALWQSAFEQVSDDSLEDRALLDAGLWFVERLANARRAWADLPRLEYTSIELGRALVGAVNFQTARSVPIALANILKEPLAQQHHKFEELAEGVQHMIASLKLPLANALQGFEPEGPPAQGEFELVNGLRRRLYLGQQYGGLLHLWSLCVNQGWRVSTSSMIDIVTPSVEEREVWFAAAHFRRDTISTEMSLRAREAWSRMNPRRRGEIANVPVVHQVSRHGKRLKPQLATIDVSSSEPPFAWIARVMAREQYLEDVIDEPLPRFDGLSARDLLNVLWVLSPLATLLPPATPEAHELRSLDDFVAFAPRLHREDLGRTLRAALGFSQVKAHRAISILSFDGSFRDDLWQKPLIPLDGDWLTIVFEALRTPNLLWLVDRWLRDGEFDMAARGSTFEANLRKALAEECTLATAQVLPHALKLPVGNGLEEDIDLVIRIGETVLVGEAKCTVYPTDPFEFRHYEDTLRAAATQVERKAEAARRHSAALLAKTKWTDVDPNDLSVVPCVISNLPLGTGYPTGGSAVADEYILARYLGEGGVPQFITQNADGTQEVGQFTRFYSSPEEAARTIARYLEAPPAIRGRASVRDGRVKRYDLFRRRTAGPVHGVSRNSGVDTKAAAIVRYVTLSLSSRRRILQACCDGLKCSASSFRGSARMARDRIARSSRKTADALPAPPRRHRESANAFVPSASAAITMPHPSDELR